MKDNAPTTHDDLTPQDDFERQWTALLAEREPDLPRTEDAFVQGVLDRHAAETQGCPAIVGRVGFGTLPFAAAAALLIAALIGWYLFTNPGTAPINEGVVEKQDPQPDEPQLVHNGVDPAKLQLGKLISQTQTTVTKPATSLTQTVRDTPQVLRVDRLLDLIDTPIPDLKEILEPLKPADQQSRA